MTIRKVTQLISPGEKETNKSPDLWDHRIIDFMKGILKITESNAFFLPKKKVVPSPLKNLVKFHFLHLLVH